MSSEMPARFRHDCDACVYLGMLKDPDGRLHDLYVCDRDCHHGWLVDRTADVGSGFSAVQSRKHAPLIVDTAHEMLRERVLMTARGTPGILVPPKPDPRVVDPVLVDCYRKADTDVCLAQKWGAGLLPGRPAPVGALQKLFAVRDEAAVALANDVARRADALATADASLLAQLRTLVHSAVYTLGNPMSGLGLNTTVQAALGALREAEALLEPDKLDCQTQGEDVFVKIRGFRCAQCKNVFPVQGNRTGGGLACPNCHSEFSLREVPEETP